MLAVWDIVGIDTFCRLINCLYHAFPAVHLPGEMRAEMTVRWQWVEGDVEIGATGTRRVAKKFSQTEQEASAVGE